MDICAIYVTKVQQKDLLDQLESADIKLYNLEYTDRSVIIISSTDTVEATNYFTPNFKVKVPPGKEWPSLYDIENDANWIRWKMRWRWKC